MPLPQPFPGLVLHYAYLWHDQHRRGLEEGVKHRPCIMVSVTAVSDEQPLVAVVPLTHLPPSKPEQAIEIPIPTKARLGLDHQPTWAIITEVNYFRWPGLDLRQIPGRPSGTFAYGVLSPVLFRRIRDGVVRSAGHRALLATPR